MERTLRLLPAKYHRNQKTNQYIMQKCEDPAQPRKPGRKTATSEKRGAHRIFTQFCQKRI